jgi:hypothetical protein
LHTAPPLLQGRAAPPSRPVSAEAAPFPAEAAPFPAEAGAFPAEVGARNSAGDVCNSPVPPGQQRPGALSVNAQALTRTAAAPERAPRPENALPHATVDCGGPAFRGPPPPSGFRGPGRVR